MIPDLRFVWTVFRNFHRAVSPDSLPEGAGGAVFGKNLVKNPAPEAGRDSLYIRFRYEAGNPISR